MAATDDDGFITLPPGIFDSGTFKLPPKTERPRVEREEIVFVPTVPGMPVPVVDDPEDLASVPAAIPPVAAQPPAEVSHETRRAPVDPYESPVVAAAPLPAAAAPPTAEVPVVAAPAAASALPRWRLVLPDGAEAIVNGVTLVGRNPAPFDAYPGAEMLAVADTTQSVSKTHAAFEVDEQGLWVHDLDSTNGVWVVRGDDVTEALPRRRVQVLAGSSVELGDYVLTVAHR